MRDRKLLDTIRPSRPAFRGPLHLGSSRLFEMASWMRFNAIWMDLKHHSSGLEKASQWVRVSRAATTGAIAHADIAETFSKRGSGEHNGQPAVQDCEVVS